MTRESEERRERAERILAAAAELLIRYGYNRVTIDDIAAKAEIGKGTVYLHWKTKEALFGTLFLREVLVLERRFLERVRADAHEVLPHRMYGGMMLDAWRRPIGWALLTGDQEMMGKLVKSALGKAMIARGKDSTAAMFRLWREQGLLDAGTDPVAQAYAFRATADGFMQMEAHPDKFPLSPEAKVAAFSETIRRAFEPSEPPSPEVLAEVAASVAHDLAQLCLAVEQLINEQLQS